MNLIRIVAALLAACFAAPVLAAFVPGQIIVGSHTSKPGRQIGRLNVYVLKVPKGSERAEVARMSRLPGIDFAELDQIAPPAMVPNDSYYQNEWHLQAIGAPSAWDYGTGNPIVIAILDSGVDSTHPDLAAHVVPGWNFYDNNADTSDVTGHGTGIAGIAAAVLNNGAGVAGVAGSAYIMPIRIADTSGFASWSTVAQAVSYAADHGAKVANLSFSNMVGSSAVQSAAQYLKDRGGLLVVAAGNNAKDEGWPQSSTMIPVSATNESDVFESWSSYGQFVALCAPGQDIATTQRGGTYGFTWWGTSVSAPIVSGTIALMMAANPSLSNAQVEGLLYSTAVDLGEPGRDVYYGYGRVNAAAAVQAAIGYVQPPPPPPPPPAPADTSPPSVTISSPNDAENIGSKPVRINATAKDNVGVVGISVLVDGRVIGTASGASISINWNPRKYANGQHSITVTARDAAGNTGSQSITVIKS